MLAQGVGSGNKGSFKSPVQLNWAIHSKFYLQERLDLRPLLHFLLAHPLGHLSWVPRQSSKLLIWSWSFEILTS